MTTAVSVRKEQYLLRVRRNSVLEKALDFLAEHKTSQASSLQTAVARQGITWELVLFSKMTDNLSVVKSGDTIRASYVDVTPSTPVSIGLDVNYQPAITNDALPVSAPVGDISDIRWPQAPPLIESMGDKFQQPSWFKTMKTMVSLGRHIALSGAPGTGKDTAVQELAAREGRILVTIGGDAGFRRRDLTGQQQLVGGHSYLDVAEYAAAVINGWWVCLSEVNAADADALMYINAQLAAPFVVTLGGKTYPVHPDFRLFVTYNPGLTGTKPLPQSFKDRFFSIQVPFYTAAQLTKVLVAHGAPEDAPWLSVVVQYGLYMWDAHIRGQIRYQITSRRLMDAVALLVSGAADNFKEALKWAVVASIDSPIEAKVAEQLLAPLSMIS